MCGKSLNDEIAVYAAKRRHHIKPVRTCSQAPVPGSRPGQAIPAKAGIQRVGEVTLRTGKDDQGMEAIVESRADRER